MLPQNICVTLNQIILYYVAVLKRVALQLHCVTNYNHQRYRIRFPDRDPTGFCNSELDLDRSGFRKNSTGSDTDIQTALITAVKCLMRGFSDIRWIGSNIWTVLPY